MVLEFKIEGQRSKSECQNDMEKAAGIEMYEDRLKQRWALLIKMD